MSKILLQVPTCASHAEFSTTSLRSVGTPATTSRELAKSSTRWTVWKMAYTQTFHNTIYSLYIYIHIYMYIPRTWGTPVLEDQPSKICFLDQKGGQRVLIICFCRYSDQARGVGPNVYLHIPFHAWNVWACLGYYPRRPSRVFGAWSQVQVDDLPPWMEIQKQLVANPGKGPFCAWLLKLT